MGCLPLFFLMVGAYLHLVVLQLVAFIQMAAKDDRLSQCSGYDSGREYRPRSPPTSHFPSIFLQRAVSSYSSIIVYRMLLVFKHFYINCRQPHPKFCWYTPQDKVYLSLSPEVYNQILYQVRLSQGVDAFHLIYFSL